MSLSVTYKSAQLLAGVKVVHVHLFRVAGNIVWSHMAGDAPWLWDRFPMKSYSIQPFNHSLKMLSASYTNPNVTLINANRFLSYDNKNREKEMNLVWAVEKSENISLLHRHLTWTLLLIVIQSHNGFTTDLVNLWSLLLLQHYQTKFSLYSRSTQTKCMKLKVLRCWFRQLSLMLRMIVW